MISRARYDELIAAGLPAEIVGNGSGKRKAAASAGAIAEDTIEEPPRSAKMKSGAKKVQAKTTEVAGEAIAGLVTMAADKIIRDERKRLEAAEAKSIGMPLSRIINRHLPDWLKKYLPAGSANDDISDLQEVGATLAKWGVRFVLISWGDYQRKQEEKKKTRQQREAGIASQAPAPAMIGQAPAPAARPESNGHAPAINPLIAAFASDIGGEI